MSGLSKSRTIYREKMQMKKQGPVVATNVATVKSMFCRYCKSNDHFVGHYNKSRSRFVETCPVLLLKKAKETDKKRREQEQVKKWKFFMSKSAQNEHGGDNWETAGSSVRVRNVSQDNRAIPVSKNPFDMGEVEQDEQDECQESTTLVVTGVWANVGQSSVMAAVPEEKVSNEMVSKPVTNAVTNEFKVDCGNCGNWGCPNCDSVVSNETSCAW